MNYKDDRQKAMSWLQRLGNPYRLSLYDGNGMLGLGSRGLWRAGDVSHRRSGHYPLAARRRPERTGVARGAPAAVGSIQPEGGLMRRVIVILLALMLTGQTWAAIDTPAV